MFMVTFKSGYENAYSVGLKLVCAEFRSCYPINIDPVLALLGMHRPRNRPNESHIWVYIGSIFIVYSVRFAYIAVFRVISDAK